MTEFPDKAEVEATAKWYRSFIMWLVLICAAPSIIGAILVWVAVRW